MAGSTVTVQTVAMTLTEETKNQANEFTIATAKGVAGVVASAMATDPKLGPLAIFAAVRKRRFSVSHDKLQASVSKAAKYRTRR